MKKIQWDLLKSEKLKRDRGLSFEEIIQARFVGALEHPRKTHQRLLLFELRGYIWVVPYMEHGDEMFLKTLFPSRKYTKIWKRGKLK